MVAVRNENDDKSILTVPLVARVLPQKYCLKKHLRLSFKIHPRSTLGPKTTHASRRLAHRTVRAVTRRLATRAVESASRAMGSAQGRSLARERLAHHQAASWQRFGAIAAPAAARRRT